MFDNILSAIALTLFAAVIAAAALSPRNTLPAPSAAAMPVMTVVTLPAVQVVAKRLPPDAVQVLAAAE